MPKILQKYDDGLAVENDYVRGTGVTGVPRKEEEEFKEKEKKPLPKKGKTYTADSPHFWNEKYSAWVDEDGDVIPRGIEWWGSTKGEYEAEEDKRIGLGVKPGVGAEQTPRESGRQTLGAGKTKFQPLDASDSRDSLTQLGDKKDSIRVENLRVGIYTQSERQERPLGAMDDCRNFVLSKKRGALVQRQGYTADNAGTITDGVLASITQIYDFRKFSGANQNYNIYVGTDGANANIIQDSWRLDGAVKSTKLAWGQWVSVTGSAVGAATLTTTLTNAAYIANYFRYGVVFNSTRSEYLFISSSSATPNVIFTFSENLPGDWAFGDTYTLYRDFHDNTGFVDYIYASTTIPVEPISLLAQGPDTFLYSFIDSAGNFKPTLSTAVNKTFFSGSGNTPTFSRTYISEAEIKSTAGFSYSSAASYASVGTGLDSSKRYFIGFVYQTDDGQLSTLIKPSTDYLTPAADQGIASTVTIDFARMNKRFRSLNVFLGESTDTSATTLEWDKYYYVTQYDLTGTGWTHNVSTGTAPGNFTRAIQLNITNWNAKQETLVEHLGTEQYTSSMTNWQYATFVGNRLLAGYLLNYPSTIAHSIFSGAGVAQYNVMPNIEGAGWSTLPGTDVITGLERLEDSLFVARPRSVGYISIGGDPTSWVFSLISNKIGCDASQTLRSTPLGVIWANSAMGLYLWRGSDVVHLSKNFSNDFQNIPATNKTSWIGWYDSFLSTINFMLDSAVANNKKDFYSFFTEIPVNGSFAFTKQRLNVALDSVITPEGAFTGQVYFSQNATANTFYFSPSSFDDSGTAIVTYFDTGEHTTDESRLAHFSEWYMSLATSGTKANGLDVSVYIGGSLLKTYASLTKTNSRFRAMLPIVGSDGMTWRIVWNSNATPATFIPTSTADPFGLSIYEFGFDGVTEKAWVGDAGSQRL